MTMRIVTMADFHAFKAVGERLDRATQEAATLAADAARIVDQAAAEGRVNWALGFGMQATDNGVADFLRMAEEWVQAAEHFTGEKLSPSETLDSYCSRIAEALGDIYKLDAMLKRNGIRFVFD